MFYPGRPDRIGGATHIPVESLRLKLIREGHKDYEYLLLLTAASEDRAWLGAHIAEVVRGPNDFANDAETFARARRWARVSRNVPAAACCATAAMGVATANGNRGH